MALPETMATKHVTPGRRSPARCPSVSLQTMLRALTGSEASSKEPSTFGGSSMTEVRRSIFCCLYKVLTIVYCL